MISSLPPETRLKEVAFVRVDLVYGWLKQLELFHRDAGRPAMAEGVKSSTMKIRREIANSNKPP